MTAECPKFSIGLKEEYRPAWNFDGIEDFC
jgi:hypothetical protein